MRSSVARRCGAARWPRSRWRPRACGGERRAPCGSASSSTASALYRALQDGELAGRQLPLIDARRASCRRRAPSDGVDRRRRRPAAPSSSCAAAASRASSARSRRSAARSSSASTSTSSSPAAPYAVDGLALRELARRYPDVAFVAAANGPREVTLQRPAANVYRVRRPTTARASPASRPTPTASSAGAASRSSSTTGSSAGRPRPRSSREFCALGGRVVGRVGLAGAQARAERRRRRAPATPTASPSSGPRCRSRPTCSRPWRAADPRGARPRPRRHRRREPRPRRRRPRGRGRGLLRAGRRALAAVARLPARLREGLSERACQRAARRPRDGLPQRRRGRARCLRARRARDLSDGRRRPARAARPPATRSCSACPSAWTTTGRPWSRRASCASAVRRRAGVPSLADVRTIAGRRPVDRRAAGARRAAELHGAGLPAGDAAAVGALAAAIVHVKRVPSSGGARPPGRRPRRTRTGRTPGVDGERRAGPPEPAWPASDR